jgi:hypothetical protein
MRLSAGHCLALAEAAVHLDVHSFFSVFLDCHLYINMSYDISLFTSSRFVVIKS